MDHRFLSVLDVLCNDIDSARSLTVRLMVKYGEWDQLVKLVCSPYDYEASKLEVTSQKNILIARILRKARNPAFAWHSPASFRGDYQITELLRKCEDLPTTYDREAAALTSFEESEEMCRVSNGRLKTLRWQLDNCYAGPIQDTWLNLTVFARREIASILGPIPDDLQPSFSSGSTYRDRLYILPQDKMSNRPAVTSACWEVVKDLWDKTLWSKSLCSERPGSSTPLIVEGNRFSSVPKTAITNRGICVEPVLNVAYQLSVGKIIRKRLRRVGIDLKFGQTVHGKAVRSASMTRDVGTIDLSAASDSVSYQLVKLLLPREWFDLLDALRSPRTKVQGVWKTNYKFSSMGNGYTFELETLIFFAISKAVARALKLLNPYIKVYGDDIIVDTAVARPLIRALNFFGFKTNSRKTFVDGVPFRESCGQDYYHGQPVRGHYIKKIPTEAQDFIALANGIRRMSKYEVDTFGGIYSYKRAWNKAVGALTSHQRKCVGPEHLGDFVIHDGGNYPQGKRIKVLAPQWDEHAFSRYDKRVWTRGSIISAALLGALHGCGLHHTQLSDGSWRIVDKKQRVPRAEPTGYSVKNYTILTDGAPLAERLFSNNDVLYEKWALVLEYAGYSLDGSPLS